ncbi:MAG: response regulator transcription factor, partial [Cyanobacteria bacterium]|nr:response regulator transcription factor [Cyanobacteriota bacterium]
TFSAREVEIIELIAQGKSNKEIAETLHITQGTVKNYVTKILGHLNLRDRTQLAIWARDVT